MAGGGCPAIRLLMKPLNALSLYRARLRAHWMGECLAAVGIAAGVALLFASEVSSSSLQSSVSQLSRGIAGHATLQVLARSPQGMPEGLLRRVRAIRGVRVAAPVLESGANAIGVNGRSASVQLIGADGSLARLGGELVHNAALRPFAGVGAVVLPAPVARVIGVRAFGQEVHFQLAGRKTELPLYSQLHENQVGSLAASALAIVPLSSAQKMTGLTARLSRILVEPAAGAQGQVRTNLQRLAKGRLNVESIDHEEKLFAKAAAASNQSSALFAAVSALVGFLFAYNAMLLTAPQRRRLVLDLRRNGYTATTVIGVLTLDAVILGVIACALGLVLGEELSLHVLHSNPAFLSLAFAVGSQRIVTWESIAIAGGGGMLAATVAVLVPLRDVLARDPPDVVVPQTSEQTTHALRGSTLASAACAGTATLLLLAAPDAAIPGMVLLVASLLLLLPLALSAALALLQRLARTIVGVVAHVAVVELRTAGPRAVAITATGAIAIFGSVAIRGAHDDLLRGLTDAAHQTNGLTDLWISPAGSYNLMSTAPFRAVEQSKLEHLPGVTAVRLYRGGLLDYGQRRALVLAPPRRVHAATLGSPDRAGRPAHRNRTSSRRRLARALAGARLRTPPPRRATRDAPYPGSDQHADCGAVDQHWLGARRDHHERLGLCRARGVARTQARTTSSSLPASRGAEP